MGENKQFLLTDVIDDFMHVIGRKMGSQSFARTMRTNKRVKGVLSRVRRGPKVSVDLLRQTTSGWEIVYGPIVKIGPNLTRSCVALHNETRYMSCFRFAVENVEFLRDASNPQSPFTTDFVAEFLNFAKENVIAVPIYSNIKEIMNADFNDDGSMVRKIFKGLGVKTVTTTDKFLVDREHLCPQMIPSSVTAINLTNTNFGRNELLGLKAKSFMIGFKDMRSRDITDFLLEWKCGQRFIEDGTFLKTDKALQNEVLRDLKPTVLYIKSLHDQSVLAPLPVRQLPLFVSDSEFYILHRPSSLEQRLLIIIEKSSIMLMGAGDPVKIFESYLSPEQYRMITQ